MMEATSQPDTHGGLEHSFIHRAQVKDGNVIHRMLLTPLPIAYSAVAAVCPGGRCRPHPTISWGSLLLRGHYLSDLVLRAVFLGLVLRWRFGWAGASAIGASVSSGTVSASGSGVWWLFRAWPL